MLNCITRQKPLLLMSFFTGEDMHTRSIFFSPYGNKIHTFSIVSDGICEKGPVSTSMSPNGKWNWRQQDTITSTRMRGRIKGSKEQINKLTWFSSGKMKSSRDIFTFNFTLERTVKRKYQDEYRFRSLSSKRRATKVNGSKMFTSPYGHIAEAI